MGKRIIQQARGHGSFSYRVRRNAYRFRLKYPRELKGEGTVIKLFNSAGHSAPLAKIKYERGIFYIPACKGIIEGQKISFEEKEAKTGNILKLKDIPLKTQVYDIESNPGDGGVFIRTGGNYAVVNKIVGENIFLLLPSKKERKFNSNCRAIIGVIAGAGRLDKPVIKAGKKFHMKKSRNRLWPRTSAVKMNVIDHPFGSGRGKRIKSKIAKRNAPPGARVGLIRPRRTGRKKR
ncbi:MAG: 50S ribosomal protein L2 [Candidatus Pacearchaeota archaeon]|nr:50S ribosomal protein L2 [Candidatus Pacearchaeota archaeon]